MKWGILNNGGRLCNDLWHFLEAHLQTSNTRRLEWAIAQRDSYDISLYQILLRVGSMQRLSDTMAVN